MDADEVIAWRKEIESQLLDVMCSCAAILDLVRTGLPRLSLPNGEGSLIKEAESMAEQSPELEDTGLTITCPFPHHEETGERVPVEEGHPLDFPCGAGLPNRNQVKIEDAITWVCRFSWANELRRRQHGA